MFGVKTLDKRQLGLYRLLTIAIMDDLWAVYHHCVRHLETLHHHRASDIQFDFDGDRSWTCSCSLPNPLNFTFSDEPVTTAPLIFQVIGQIARPNSTMTSDGITERSFWIESRPDRISRALWSQIPQSLDFLTQATNIDFNLSQFWEFDRVAGQMRLQIVWTSETTNIVSTFASLLANLNIDP